MHRLHGIVEAPTERVAWVLDDAWPETASMVAALWRPGDQFIAPGIFGPRPPRYRWPVGAQHSASLATVRRHWSMKRVAKAPGAVRQRVYLAHDRTLARELASRIDYRARHLVVAQAWLPWLGEALGGRTFDVVMSRYPFAEIHRRLDQAAAEIGPSATIADFRADADLVERESELLRRARRIYTPHHGIASLFLDKAVLLAWHKPAPMPRQEGRRVAFLGPTIARQRPDIARALATHLDEPLIVFGSVLEGCWGKVPIERRVRDAHWLDGIGAILHPAILTHQPRALIEALANGVTVYATKTCGLREGDYLRLEQFPRL